MSCCACSIQLLPSWPCMRPCANSVFRRRQKHIFSITLYNRLSSMGKKAKGKHRLDKFYHLAKEQGYRSRAAFKLIQLNRKYNFLSNARALLDLCAAPGGWCQVASKNMPVGSLILGVDLDPIKPIRGVKTFVGDITTQKCRQIIKNESGGSLMDVVLCDGAPNVGGAWSSEAYTQAWLVLEALRMACDTLAPRGTFVTKVFRSKDYSALLYAMNQLFDKVEATKPAASRNASAEIFVVCQGYKAPAKIDPRLLDAKHIFQEVTEAPKVMGPDALLKQKVAQKRFREGYDDGVSTTHRPLPAVLFVTDDSPVEALGKFTQVAVEGGASEPAADAEGMGGDPAVAAALVRDHPATTAEIRTLCRDLQVLGRSEFKQLLKWRLLVKRDLQEVLAKQRRAGGEEEGESEEESEEGEGSEEEEEEDPEEKLLREMSEIKDRVERQRKKERRKRREAKVKSRVRAAQLAEAEGIGEEGGGPGELFTLRAIKGGKERAASVAEAEAPASDADAPSSSSGGEEAGGGESDMDSEEEQRRYDAIMDEYLEESYRSFKQRQGMKADTAKKRRRRLGAGGEMSDEEGEGGELGLPDRGSSDEEAEGDQVVLLQEGGGLIVELDERRVGVPTSAEAAAAHWFAQDLFDDQDLEDEEEGAGGGRVGAAHARAKGQQAQQRRGAAAADLPAVPAAAPGGGMNGTVAGLPDDSGDEDEEANVDTTAKQQEEGSEEEEEEEEGPRRKLTKSVGGDAAGDGFEVVPLNSEGSSDSDSEDEFANLDDRAKAEMLALAKKMLRRKVKDDIVEAAYNRFAFHDTHLPKWFAEDERKFMRPAPQVTGQEYRDAMEELKAIDARPIKKVAEAKARKRKRMLTKLTQARHKAEAIANQEDVPMKSKMREIEKLYSQARASGKGKKGAGKKKLSRSGQETAQRKGPRLDKRMKKDRRGMDKAAAKMKGKGKGVQKGGGKKGGKKR